MKRLSARLPERPRRGAFLLLGLWICLAGCTSQPQHSGAVASAHPLATAAGLEILSAGGNAFDAAVAVSAALAVVEPYSSGLGGGGFWLLHRAADGFEVMVDGRERAPLAATRNMYLDEDAAVVPGLSITGALAAGIPGEAAALVHIAQHYGRLSLRDTLAPAIRLAREGFETDTHYARMAGFRLAALQDDAESARIFLQDGEVPEPGYRLQQPELAATLAAIAEQGRDGFYSGRVAQELVAGVRAAGGIWSLGDLREYRAVEREPVIGEYGGMRIVSAAPPSSGGVVLLEMLNILAGYPLQDLDGAVRTHVIIEAMRRAYRDRARYLGDPDHVTMPVARLLSPAYAGALRASIDLGSATPSSALAGPAPGPAGRDTTHFSILDAQGNRVAATMSINYPFGACITASGTGVLLNDEMDDFSIKPGVPNVYGLIGAEANSIAPGKRPLSSMTPTFIETADGIAILGTPGGSRIITMVLLATLDLAAGGLPEDWVGRPRYHHQYLPDEVQYEPGAFAGERVTALQALGHKLKPLDTTYGNMQAIYLDSRSGLIHAASDPRGGGLAAVTSGER